MYVGILPASVCASRVAEYLNHMVNTEIALSTEKKMFLVLVWLTLAHTFKLRTFYLNSVNGIE